MPSRRQFIQAVALAGAASRGGPSLSAGHSAVISPEMKSLSQYMTEASSQLLPREVIEQAKFHIIDTLAAMVSGSQLAPGVAALSYVKTRAGQGSLGLRTVIGSSMQASAIEAALVNGVMAHSDETDDSHNRSRTHPGCAVVPAALAAGQEFAIDGTQFLRAVTLGYDIGTRVVMAMGGPKFSYESHKSSHAIGGAFGAAAAAASTAQLSAQQMRWVLDYTCQQSSGIAVWRRDTDHIEKAFTFAGMPASNGVRSALLVQNGWTGVDDVFSGVDNFFDAYAPAADKTKLVEQLGQRFEITQTDIKKWTVGSPVQGPLDAMQNIMSKQAFSADQVKSVVVRLGPDAAAVVDNREIPDICLQYLAAVMLLDKTVSFKAAHDVARMKDPKILEARRKINLIKDDTLTSFLPVRVAIVEVELSDGQRWVERVDAVRGTPRNPMTKVEVIDKCADLMQHVLGKQKTHQLIDTIFSIEQVSDLRSLGSMLRTGASR